MYRYNFLAEIAETVMGSENKGAFTTISDKCKQKITMASVCFHLVMFVFRHTFQQKDYKVKQNFILHFLINQTLLYTYWADL